MYKICTVLCPTDVEQYTDEIVQDEMIHQMPQNGVISDGLAQNGVAQNGVVPGGVVQDGNVQDGTASPKCSRFKTIEDIQSNLRTLGQKIKIYIWFAPSEATVFNPTHPGMLETRVLLFSHHLMTYGFEVKTNLSAAINNTSKDDCASLPDHEMSQAEWITCVCSKSLYDMFHNASDPTEIYCLNTKASVLNKTLYSRLLNDCALKVIPVILQEKDNNLDFVPPTLRDQKEVLRIFEETPFNIKNLDGDFERLVCHMTGINREALRFAEDNHHQGFVKLPSKILPS